MLKILSLSCVLLFSTSCLATGSKHKTSTKIKKKSHRAPASVNDGSFELLRGKESYSTVMAQLEVNLDKCLKFNDNRSLSCIIDFDDHKLYSLTPNKSFTTKRSAPECAINLSNQKLTITYSGHKKLNQKRDVANSKSTRLKYKKEALTFYAICLNNSGFSKTNTNPKKNIYTSKQSFPFVSW